MKNTWDKLCLLNSSFKASLETLLEMLPQSNKIYTQQSIVNKEFQKLTAIMNKMDDFVSPLIKSIEVTNPLLKDPDFSSTWKYWKDYLIEQHSIYIKSRTELMALKRLSEISGKNPKLAISFLEFAMSRGDKNFYIVNEKDRTVNQTPKNENGGMVVDIVIPQQGISTSSAEAAAVN